jgi:hypothetical protein
MARRNRKGGNTAGMKGWSGWANKPTSGFPKPTDVNIQAVKEQAYKDETGEEYQDSAKGTELKDTAMTEILKDDDTKQNIIQKLFKNKQKSIKVDSVEDQEKREKYDKEGNPIRTKTYYNEKGEPIYFRDEDAKKKYEEQKKYIEDRKFNVYGDKATVHTDDEGKSTTTPAGRTDDMYVSTHYESGAGNLTGIGGEPGKDDIKKGGYLHPNTGEYISAEEAEKIRTAHDNRREKFKIQQLEDENERLVNYDPKATGVTEDIDFSFEGELDDKYKDRDRKIDIDTETGELTEKVKRKGPAGWLGMHKKTGRTSVDDAYAQVADEQRKLEEEKKNKKNKRKKPSKEEKQAIKNKKKQDKINKEKLVNAARKDGKDHYFYEGQRYSISPKFS